MNAESRLQLKEYRHKLSLIERELSITILADKMDYAPLIEKRRQRLEELEQEIADPALFDDRTRAESIMREHRRTQSLMATWAELCSAKEQKEEASEIFENKIKDKEGEIKRKLGLAGRGALSFEEQEEEEKVK